MLAIHVFALHDLMLPSYDTADDTCVYVSLAVGSTIKVTAEKLVHSKSVPKVLFDEVKHIPVVVS